MIGAIAVGMLAALGTELAVAILLRLGPSAWPMVDRYWSFTALPAICLTVVTCTILLWGVFRTGGARYPIAFTLTYLASLIFELHYFGNPPEDIARYLCIAALVCTIILGGLYRLTWRYQPIP